MRDIRFRGKRVDSGKWIYGNFLQPWNGVRYLATIHDGLYAYEVIPESVGQFTCLKDKNGKEMYEGDICINEHGLSDYYYVVEWIFAGFQLVTHKKPNSNVRGISHGINQGYMETADFIEVIGNIHDNPSLLEVQP